MELSSALKLFIQEHANDDTDKLLLSASRFPGIDIPFAVNQILSRHQIQEKLPSWYANENLIYPSRLSTEQCSSEITAIYKQQLLRGNTFCDLTGGLGVDTYFFAQKAQKVTYIERYAEYCAAARHNFAILGFPNIQIVNNDVRKIIHSMRTDTFYIDPARRTESNKRAFALTDCEPDVLQLKPLLLDHAQRVILKISPMADLEETLRLLPETREIHILSVKNECKELLFVLENGSPLLKPEEIKIHAINFRISFPPQEFIFTIKEEKEAYSQTTETIKNYLYEPYTALLKGGAFKLIASRYGLLKLHRHSHLYTSDHFCTAFPGRSFQVNQTFEFSGKLLKQIGKQIPKANLTVRNFPLSVSELRKRSHIKEGGDLYLFATTLANEHKVFIITHKAEDIKKVNNP